MTLERWALLMRQVAQDRDEWRTATTRRLSFLDIGTTQEEEGGGEEEEEDMDSRA
jgi:hypothetical protein